MKEQFKHQQLYIHSFFNLYLFDIFFGFILSFHSKRSYKEPVVFFFTFHVLYLAIFFVPFNEVHAMLYTTKTIYFATQVYRDTSEPSGWGVAKSLWVILLLIQ